MKRGEFNDPGRANGIFELWIDDRLEARVDGLNWQGAYSDYGINIVFLESYWNDGAPQPQERYFDNFVVSTQAGVSSLCPPARSLELCLHLSYRGHGLDAQCR